MELSIIILNYKTKRLLRQCLKGIFRFPPSVPFEVVVVDNGSEDGTGELIHDEFPKVGLIELPKNVGYAKGSNVGISSSRGKHILFLNADAVVLQGSIDSLYRYLLEHPQTAAVGPRLNNADGTLQESAYRFPSLGMPAYTRTPLGRTPRGRSELNRYLFRDWDHQSDRGVGWLMSSCLMVRREALHAVGNFDERYFVYFADTDLCRRLWLAGWHVRYTPSAVFYHYHRKQSAEDWRVAKIHIVDWIRYVWKWRGQAAPEIGV